MSMTDRGIIGRMTNRFLIRWSKRNLKHPDAQLTFAALMGLDEATTIIWTANKLKRSRDL